MGLREELCPSSDFVLFQSFAVILDLNVVLSQNLIIAPMAVELTWADALGMGDDMSPCLKGDRNTP